MRLGTISFVASLSVRPCQLAVVLGTAERAGVGYFGRTVAAVAAVAAAAYFGLH